MSIFKRIFKEKVDQVKKEVDQAEELLAKAQEKITALNAGTKIPFLREALGDLIQNYRSINVRYGHETAYLFGDSLAERKKQIEDKEKEIAEVVDEICKMKCCCRFCN